MGDQLKCLVREALEEDLPYVLETLAHHGLRDRWPRPRLSERKQAVLDVIARDEVVTVMAVNPEAPDAFYGFCLYELPDGPVPPFLHYVYVKKVARRMGVARRMLAGFEGRVEVGRLPDFRLPDRFVLNVNRSVL